MPIIAVIFDYDDTLLPDSTTQLLARYGIDPKKFWSRDAKALIEAGYDPSTAYLNLILKNVGEGKSFGNLTNRDLRVFGKEIERTHYPGIEDLILDLKETAEGAYKGIITVEFFVISGGLYEIIRGASLIDKYFSGVYASQLCGDTEDGTLKYIKRTVSFTEKTRYIFEINKGISPAEGIKNPYLVNMPVPKEERRIPISNMIYVGDGFSDIPCFSLLSTQEPKGCPFGVFDPADQESAKKALINFLRPDRVISMHAPKYGKNDELGSLLRAAVAAKCAGIIISQKTAIKAF